MSKRKTSIKKKIIKFILAVVLILLIVIVAACVTAFMYVNDKIGRMNKIELNETELAVSENENLTGYRNIAIFGIDSRANNYGKGNRSDCIIIASINNETHEVKLVSVYRDTYAQIQGHGLDKITHAYSYGGAELALKTLNENLDLNITEFVTVNFDAVVDAVDALGGIKMKITSAEVTQLNSILIETSAVTGKKSKKITSAGTHVLDGVQAVAYSRIRYTSGGDYKRTERMRDVITAMVEKLKTKSVSEINKIADKILPKVYTKLSLTDLWSMVPAVASFSVGESLGWPYEIRGATINEIWYGVPATLESNVKKLHQEVFEDEDYEVPSSVRNISQKIINKTGYSK